MKLIKCGKIDEYNYCITQQLAGRVFRIPFFELFLEVTNDRIVEKWLQKHAKDNDIKCLGIAYGVVSVGMNGKPKTKFRDHKFARFRLETHKIKDVLEYADKILSRIYQFKILADVEGIQDD